MRLKLTKDGTLESKEDYLKRKIKSTERKLKKYIKEDDRVWVTKMNYLIYDLEEQLKELQSEK
jgi:hypothetical protein